MNRVAEIPAAVARYLAFAIEPGHAPIDRATFTQTGTMRSGAGATWTPFTAIERITTRPIGFTWDARAHVAPLVPIAMHDGYGAGSGVSYARIAGIIPVPGPRNTPDLATAALVRYLAEAAWFPTALEPSDCVRWSALDERHATVELTDCGLTVSVDVTFGERGEILDMATMRYRTVGRAMVLTPWYGHYSDYAQTSGLTIPFAAEVAWGLPAGKTPVWRGRLQSAAYTLR